jgi:hypothetical protein
VRISTDNHISRPGQRFKHYLVADTFANLGNEAAGLPRKVTQENMVIGQTLIWARGSVVKE